MILCGPDGVMDTRVALNSFHLIALIHGNGFETSAGAFLQLRSQMYITGRSGRGFPPAIIWTCPADTYDPEEC